VNRRALLRATLGTGLSALSAGCGGLFAGESRVAESSSTPTRATQSPRETATPDRPYRIPEAPSLDRPRGVHVRNFGGSDRFLTLVVRDGETDVFVASRDVGAGEAVAFADLLASAGDYGVVVETADGSRERFDWTVTDAFDDLWIQLTPEIGFRRLARCTPDCPPVSTGGAVRAPLYVPTDVSAPEALDRPAAVALDNDADEPRRVRFRLWGGDALQFEYGYVVPPDVRAVVPIQPARFRYRAVVRTDDGEATHDWLPGARGTLYAVVGGEPRFRCGFTNHDLSVRNETDDDRAVTLRIGTGDESLFSGTFELAAGEDETIPAAVDPAGVFRFRVETDDGRSKVTDWGTCASNGLLIVSVREQGILLSVQPRPEP
jgi:hypothetical protein